MQQVIAMGHNRYKNLIDWVKLNHQTFFDLTSELTILRSGLHLRLSPTRLTIVEFEFRDYPAGAIEGRLEIGDVPLPLADNATACALNFRGATCDYQLWVSGVEEDINEIQIVHRLFCHIGDDGRKERTGICNEAQIYEKKSRDQARQFRRVLAGAKAKFEQECKR